MSRYQAANDMLANTWILYQRFGSQLERENDYWAVLKLDDLCTNDPTVALDVMLAILNHNAEPFVLEALRGGPLRDLLSRHGKTLDDALDQAAISSPAFAALLSTVAAPSKSAPP